MKKEDRYEVIYHEANGIWYLVDHQIGLAIKLSYDEAAIKAEHARLTGMKQAA